MYLNGAGRVSLPRYLPFRRYERFSDHHQRITWRQPKPGETGMALNGKETESKMETENRTATESLYRDPAGERPDRQGLTSHRKRVLVGDPKGRLQA